MGYITLSNSSFIHESFIGLIYDYVISGFISLLGASAFFAVLAVQLLSGIWCGVLPLQRNGFFPSRTICGGQTDSDHTHRENRRHRHEENLPTLTQTITERLFAANAVLSSTIDAYVSIIQLYIKLRRFPFTVCVCCCVLIPLNVSGGLTCHKT